MELVVECADDGIELAFVQGDRLHAFSRLDRRQATGTIYRARVIDIDRHLDGAFLDIGADQPGFIQGRDVKKSSASKGKKGQSIERFLAVGQYLPVQGSREADGDKGPRMTGRPQIQGRFLVYSPMALHNAASPRLKGHGRDRVLETLNELRPAGGLIARRLAERVHVDELASELADLERYWANTENASVKSGALPSFLDSVDTAIWHALDWPIQRVFASDPGFLARLRRIAERCFQAFALERLDGDQPIFEATGVADELAIAGAREVPLATGGRLLIEPTAACIAIDVDSGGAPALDTNLSAAEEIARQCRLRNLGGTIIVDFVDMPTKPQIQKLEEGLRRHFRHDSVPIQILPITPLGICQISRAKRGGNPLRSRQSICSACGGLGTVMS